MRDVKSFKVGDLRCAIREANEFKPVMGKNVERDDKKNSEKSYEDSRKRARDFDGGLSEKAPKREIPAKKDWNHTTLDYNPVTEPEKKYKDRVSAQLKGYSSDLEEKNGIEKSAQYDDEGKLEKHFTDARDEMEAKKKEIQKSGLAARMMDDKVFDKNHLNETTNKNMKAKRLIFKRTEFLNESHMLSRIPEEYRKDGQTIYMKDAKGNEFIVECKANSQGVIETDVKGRMNEEGDRKQFARINELFNYKSARDFAPSKPQERINETTYFKEVMDKARRATAEANPNIECNL